MFYICKVQAQNSDTWYPKDIWKFSIVLRQHLGIGSFVCEFDSFLNSRSLTMNVRVAEDSDVFEIEKKDINHFLRNNPGLMLLVNKSKYIQ